MYRMMPFSTNGRHPGNRNSVSRQCESSWCWRRSALHHVTSVLSEFSWSLFDLTQLATSAMHSEMVTESASSAAGEQEPYTWVSSAYRDVVTGYGSQSARRGQQCTGQTGPASTPTPTVLHTRHRWRTTVTTHNARTASDQTDTTGTCTYQ